MSEQEQEYTAEEILKEYNIDFENLVGELSKSADEMESELIEIGKQLESSLDKVGKLLRKEVKAYAIKFYHDHKEEADKGLKGLNTVVNDILKEIKGQINLAIQETEDSDEKRELRRLRGDLIKFSMKYNFRYAMLRIRLAMGSAGVDIKQAFS